RAGPGVCLCGGGDAVGNRAPLPGNYGPGLCGGRDHRLFDTEDGDIRSCETQCITRRTMPRPTHFEIPAENPERAMQFYSSVLGWKFNKWPGPVDYWLISTGDPGEPGIDGGLMQRRDP